MPESSFPWKLNIQRFLGVLLIYVAWLLIAAASYRHINIALLRGEAGWYQASTHESPQAQREMERSFFVKATKGHYVPLAFWLEYQFTKWAGMRGSIWKARQIAIIALLATCISLLTISAAKIWRIARVARLAVAGGVTALFIFQPRMTDMVAWPTMVLQLVWFLITVLTLAMLVQVVARNQLHLVWPSVILAYASMHAFGLGAATVAATAGILTIFWFGAVSQKLAAGNPAPRNIAVPLVALLVVSSAHSSIMFWHTPKAAPSQTIGFPFGPFEALALIGIDPLVLVTNLFAAFSIEPSAAQSFSSAWPWGILVIIASAGTLFVLARSSFRRPDPITLARFVLIAFSIVFFFACAVLIAVRQTREPGEGPFFSYINGSRNIACMSLTFLGVILVTLLPLARKRPIVAVVMLITLGITAFVARREYETKVYPTAVHYARIPHGRAWRLILAVASESRAADLPIPNVPMHQLAWWDWSLTRYEQLLHDELHLKPEERCQFMAWDECRGPMRIRYERDVPSLKKLIRLLELEPKKKQPFKDESAVATFLKGFFAVGNCSTPCPMTRASAGRSST